MGISTFSEEVVARPSIKSSWLSFVEHFPVLSVTWVLSGFLYLIWTFIFYICTYGGLLLDIALAYDYYYYFEEGTFTLTGIAIGGLTGIPLLIVICTILTMVQAVPAIYYARGGKRVSAETAFKELNRRKFRYIFAGLFYTLMLVIGTIFCIVPGIVIGFIGPIYVNRIFVTNKDIFSSFNDSFKSLFASKDWFKFILVSFLGCLILTFSGLLTCNMSYFALYPMYCFYIQRYAYYKGILN